MPATENRFNTDQPILLAKDDLLGRKNFADLLADNLAAWKGEESLVIGLYGEWGSGKTSVKNLVIEKLHAASQEPKIIDFNPWQWASQDQVAQAFFKEVGTALDDTVGDDSSEIKITWNHLSTIVMEVGSELLASPEVFLPNADSSWYAKPVLKVFGYLLKKATSNREKDRVSKQSASETKTRLRTLFQGLKQTVLVFIDDVDRLSNSEIELLVQLIKVNADFPKMVYVLLCDRKRVEEALELAIPVTAQIFWKRLCKSASIFQKWNALVSKRFY